MLTWRDILSYIRLFLRWWYVLLLAVLLSAGTAWFILRRQPDLYVSQATLMVGNNFAVASPNGDAVRLSNVLASYYASMVTREVILGPVVEQLQLEFPWTLVRDRMLNVSIDQGANLLEIIVLDTDPVRGAAIANAIADRLVAYTPSAAKDAEAQQAELERQIAETQDNIHSTEAKIEELEQRLRTLSSAIDISDLQKQLDSLEKARDKYTTDYTNLLALRNESSVNSLTLFEQAQPSPRPVPKKTALTLGAAAIGGLMLAIIAVLLLDKLDERWRTAGELQNRTGIKSLGEVPGETPLAVQDASANKRRERAVRDTYSNMVLAAKSHLPRSLLVSSPQPSRSRSAMTLDIAEMYVRTGHRVLLVDAETDRTDITDLLEAEQNNLPPASQCQWDGVFTSAPDGERSIWRFVRATARPGIVLLSARESGYTRFASLVPSVYWPEMMQHLYKVADVVIFDGPAALTGPDASLLAPLVDGVLLVLNGKQDTRSTVLKAQKQLMSQPTSHFLGAIVTRHVRNTRAVSKLPEGGPQADKGLRISVGASGITISFGGGPAAPRQSHHVDQAPVSPRLLPPGEEHVAASPLPARAEGQADDQEKITWEQLIELEFGARTADVQANRAAGDSARPPDGQPRTVIITPPPPTAAQQAGTAAIYTAPLAGPASRPRKARIAQGRRSSRAGR